MQQADRLRLTEIFYSLQGESTTVGLPTVFIRLTGCPLRCQYCDTAYAFHGGLWHTFEEIFQKVSQFKAKHITITGGEPLTQKGVFSLMTQLLDKGYVVSIETSGALDISQVDSRVMKVVDIKTPGSQEDGKNLLSNLQHLKSDDQVKFVICHRKDYEWSKQFIAQYGLEDTCQLLFSPSHEELAARELADWILADGLNVRFQIQLHKYLWGNEPGR